MDLPSFWAEAGKLGFVVLMLIVALRWMVLRMHALEEKRDVREAESRAECQQTNQDLAERLRKIEDEWRNQGHQDRVKLLECVHRSTRAFEILAEKLPIMPPSGPYPTQGG